jgi:hypothetical protein
MSPHKAGAGGEEGAGFDGEHADSETLADNNAAMTTEGVRAQPFNIWISSGGPSPW